MDTLEFDGLTLSDGELEVIKRNNLTNNTATPWSSNAARHCLPR